MQYVDLPLEAIRDHPDNPRRDLGDLTELVDSIKAKGILAYLGYRMLRNDRKSKRKEKP